MNLKIQILIVSTSYPSDDSDWRGRFVADMVEGLSGIDSIILKTWLPPGKIPENVINCALPKESKWLKELMDEGGVAHLLRAGDIRIGKIIFKLFIGLRRVYAKGVNTDVYHINWLQNILPLWGNSKPALITVLGTDYKLLQIPGMVFLLRRVIKQRKCIIAPNAEWMAPLLKKHFDDIADVYSIPFGIHERWFRLQRKTNFENTPQKWLAVLRLTRNKIGPLFDWGRYIFDGENQLHLFGPNQENLVIPNWVYYHGPTFPEELEERWFPGAAGLITLSRHDEGRPQIILDAMAAGLPVIASDSPAHRDIIRHKETGLLVDSKEELKRAVDFLSVEENNRRIGDIACQRIKEKVGTWSDCAVRYGRAYHRLLARH